MSSSPLHKSCQPCPWSPNWPHPGCHYLPLTIYIKTNPSKTMRPTAYMSHISMIIDPLHKSCQPCPCGFPGGHLLLQTRIKKRTWKNSETMRPAAQVLKQYNILTNQLMQQKVMLCSFLTGLLPVVWLFIETYISDVKLKMSVLMRPGRSRWL